jgi:hypothetical protein
MNEDDRPGATRDTAVVVTSTREEYDWLHDHYPGCTVILQHVIEGAIPLDALTLKTEDGAEFEIFFDISSFYGKSRYTDYYDEDDFEEDEEKKKKTE